MPQYIDDQKVESELKPKHFGPMFLVAIVVVAVLAITTYAGIWWWGNRNSQVVTTSDLKDWRIYRNHKYNFEFKYPGSWSAPRENSSFADLGCPVIKTVSGTCPLHFDVYSAIIGLQGIIDGYSGETGGSKSEITYGIINGIKTASFSRITNASYPYDYYVFLGENYNVVFSDYWQTYKNDPIYSQMLATFKFFPRTNQRITYPPSEWLTYTNNGHKYSIKYPPNWTLDSDLAESDTSQLAIDYPDLAIGKRIAGVNVYNYNLSNSDNDRIDHGFDMTIGIPDPAITVDQFISLNWTNVPNIKNIKHFFINGKKSISFYLDPSPNGFKTSYILVEDAHQVYSFIYIESDPDIEKTIKDTVETFSLSR